MKRIEEYIKGAFFKIRMSILNKCREKIYEYEFKEILDKKIADSYYISSLTPDLRVGVLCPAIIATKLLEKYFGFEKVQMLRIHGIEVDTQSVDAITVTIKLNRPGLLIGKGGCHIYALEKMMTDYFNKKTDIRIFEVKKDVNLPAFVWI
jgi:hypothetical protein